MGLDAAYGQIAEFIDDEGDWRRPPSTLREWVRERPEAGRYHLYVSLACPWASRTLIARKLKRLEELLPVTIVDPIRDEHGWRFTADDPDPTGATYLSELYERTVPGYDGRISVPVLWDNAEGRIVNNESSELLRMLGGWSDEGPEFYPDAHAGEIDAVNERVYDGLNNGVYRAGFATSQAAYEQAANDVFATLDWIAARLERSRWLIPGTGAPTEAVELDAGADHVAVLRRGVQGDGQMLGFEYLQLQRHRQPILGSAVANADQCLAAFEHGAAGERLQPVEIGQPGRIGIQRPVAPQRLDPFA